MILALSGLALATAPVEVGLWTDDRIDAAEAIYLETWGPGCADLEILDFSGDPIAATCEVLGASAGGDVLLLLPETEWPSTSTITVGGLAIEIAPRTLENGTIAIPTGRTVTDDGVNFDVCRDGVVVAAVRSDAEPVDASGAILIGPADPKVYFGVVNGSWPEAVPEATASFWFATWDQKGALSEWTEDVVTLPSEGMLRTDIRFFASNACPSAGLGWSLGEEVDAEGGPPVVHPGDGDGPPDRGCGCDTGALPVGWWLLLLPFLRRYSK